MPTTDFRIQNGFFEHHKTRKLKSLLGAEAVLSLLQLIRFCATTAGRSDGNLRGMDMYDIEIASGWEGAPGALVEALAEIGWVDCDAGDFRVHDFIDHNPWAAGADKRSEAAKRAARKRWDNANRNADRAKTDADRINDATRTKNDADRNAPSPSPSPSPYIERAPTKSRDRTSSENNVMKSNKSTTTTTSSTHNNAMKSGESAASIDYTTCATQVLHETCQEPSLKAVRLKEGKVVDVDDSNKNNNWKTGDPIQGIDDLEAFVSDQGWSVQITSRDRGRVRSLIEAGAITPDEVREGLSRMGESVPKRPLSYWLSCVIAAREEYHREANKIGPKPKPHRGGRTPEELEAYLNEVFDGKK